MLYNSRDTQCKNELIYILSSQGYEAYAKLLSRFFVHVSDDPEMIAAMVPDQYILIINPARLGNSKKKASFAIRHEILHQYLDHALRAVEHLGQEVYDGRSIATQLRLNMAGDYEIHDIGMTDSDKEIIRELHGLLLDDQHPEWIGMTYEEIYDALTDEMPEQPQDQGGNQPDFPQEYIDAYNEVIDRYNSKDPRVITPINAAKGV